MKKILIALLVITSSAHASYYCEIYKNDILIDIEASSKEYATGVIGPLSDGLSMIYQTATSGLQDDKPFLYIYDSATGEKAVKYGSLEDPTRALELTVREITVNCSISKLNP